MSRKAKSGKEVSGSDGGCCCPEVRGECCGPPLPSDGAIRDEVRQSYANLITRPRRSSCCRPEGSDRAAAELAGRASSVRISAVKP
ncbi:MAG: hypothetical protein PVH68_02250 [Armatimonadota bacterium]|jgi:hypothetical protein